MEPFLQYCSATKGFHGERKKHLIFSLPSRNSNYPPSSPIIDGLSPEETSSQKLKGNSSLNRRLRIDIPSLIPRSNEANFPPPPPPFRGEKRKNTRARHGYYITRGGCTNKLDEPWLSLAASNERRGFSV